MLTVEFDYAQSRLQSDMLSMLVSGPDWTLEPVGSLAPDSPAVWIEPVKQTAMLMPAPVNPAWVKRSDGIYTKYKRADYTSLTDTDDWHEIGADEGGPFIQYFSACGNASGLTGILPSQPANQPMVVEWHQPHFTLDTSVVMECGWSDTGAGDVGVSLRVMAGGKVEVWKDGLVQGAYSLSSSGTGQASRSNVSASAPPRGFTSLMLIPFRDRELLVCSSAGGAFCHLFPDLAEGIAGHVITAAAKFWFHIPPPQTPPLRIARIQFATRGSVYSRPTAWRFPPPPGTANITLFQSLTQAEAELVSASVVNSLTNPGGLSTPKQVRADLTGGPSQTPFLYGVRAWFPPETVGTHETEGGAMDGGEDLLSASLSVSDAIGGAQVRLLLQPSETIANLRKRMGRSIRLGDEVSVFLEGISEAPTWSDGYSQETEDIDLVVRDAWKLAEEYVFADPIPLDGLSLYEAYLLVVQAFGGVAEVSAAANDVTLGASGAGGGGKWECLIEVGEKASVWLDRLHRTYAATWAHHINRAGVFVLLAPEDMPSEPLRTLYRNLEDAIAVGTDPEDAWRNVYRASHRTLLEPEANEVWVMGQDVRSGRPILVARRDAASANPALAEDLRPDNWLGRLRKYAYGDPALTSKGACLRTLDLLYARLTQGRVLIDIECEFLDGLWKGDLIRLAGAGDEGEDVIGRIKAFQGAFRHTEEGGVWRPFQYVLEVGDLVAPLGDHGANAPTIKANRHARLQTTQKRFDGELGQALRFSGEFLSFE